MHESYEEFLLELGGESACYDFFLRCRWPNGYRCPACAHPAAYAITTRRMPLFECARCHYQSSATSGTIMEGTRTPLSKWLYAMRRICDPVQGINAVQLAELVRVTYKTAYSMLDKIRKSLHDSEKVKLTGPIEAGLAIFGRDKHAALDLADNQQPVAAGLSLDDSGQPLRIALMEVSRDHMLGRTITRLGSDLFRHDFFEADPLSQANPVHRSKYLTQRHCRTLFSIYRSGFKRINDTYHGVLPRFLAKYLAEFSFRWNSLRSGIDPLLQIARTCTSPSLAA